METGIYIRMERDRKWGSHDIGEITEDEWLKFIKERETRQEVEKWAFGLREWILRCVRPE